MRTFKIEFNIDVDDKNYPNAVDDLTKAVNGNIGYLIDLSSWKEIKALYGPKIKEIQKLKYDVKG